MVFDFEKIQTIREYYRANKINASEIPEGLIATTQVYYFHLGIDNKIFQNILLPYFDNNIKLASQTFPIEFLGKKSLQVRIDRPQKLDANGKWYYSISEEEVRDRLVQKTYKQADDYMERQFDQFKTRTPIREIKPVRAAIGTKESVIPDQRFFAYEYRIDKGTSEVYSKRKAVLRAKGKIAENIDSLQNSKLPVSYYCI